MTGRQPDHDQQQDDQNHEKPKEKQQNQDSATWPSYKSLLWCFGSKSATSAQKAKSTTIQLIGSANKNKQ